MGDPCASGGGMVPGQCVRGVFVEIELSGFPDGWVDDNTHAPPGFTKLTYALLLAFDAHPPDLSVPMPGGWFEEVQVGCLYVQAKPTTDDPPPNPHKRWLLSCNVFGLAPGMGYPRPAPELAALWAGSLTTVALPEGGSCTVTVIGPYTPPPAPQEPGGGGTAPLGS